MDFHLLSQHTPDEFKTAMNDLHMQRCSIVKRVLISWMSANNVVSPSSSSSSSSSQQYNIATSPSYPFENTFCKKDKIPLRLWLRIFLRHWPSLVREYDEHCIDGSKAQQNLPQRQQWMVDIAFLNRIDTWSCTQFVRLLRKIDTRFEVSFEDARMNCGRSSLPKKAYIHGIRYLQKK
jgi:hypothetical protein